MNPGISGLYIGLIAIIQRSICWDYFLYRCVYVPDAMALSFGPGNVDSNIDCSDFICACKPVGIGGYQYLVTGLFPPRILPKMDFRVSGIPDACRTLVAVPMMLIDRPTIQAEAEKLEIRYLANKEANLFFCLYSDYKDAPQQTDETDTALLQSAIEHIETLNRRYGEERFFLLHRERKWSESEQKYIGWERKRGKLEELNELITGVRPREAGQLVRVGDAERLNRGQVYHHA